MTNLNTGTSLETIQEIMESPENHAHDLDHCIEALSIMLKNNIKENRDELYVTIAKRLDAKTELEEWITSLSFDDKELYEVLLDLEKIDPDTTTLLDLEYEMDHYIIKGENDAAYMLIADTTNHDHETVERIIDELAMQLNIDLGEYLEGKGCIKING